MSDFDKKVFKINQTEKLLNSLISSWHNFYKSFDDIRNEIHKANWRERNPLLAGCAGVVSILLGLTSINEITVSELQFYLSIDIGFAIVVFLGYGLYNFFITKTLEKSETALINSINYLESFRDHFLWITYDIEKISIEKIDDLSGFSFLIEGSNKIRMHSELAKIAEMKRFTGGFGQEINRIISQWEVGINEAIESLKEVKDEIEKEEWINYKPFIQELLDYKKES